MNGKTESFYEFAGFRLDVARRILVRHGEPVTLAPKIFDTLLFLVQNSGRILEKDQLMKALWPESFVEEGNLSQNIFALRKVLGDGRNGNSLIQTIPRRGYRFVASVRQIDASALENSYPSSPQSSLVADYWNCHSPFRSLQVFEPEDAWLFFGRDSEINELLERLARSQVLAVVGNSGSGKSSLVRAGLIPALQAGRFCHDHTAAIWRIAVFRPSGAPFDYLAEVLASQLAPELSLKEQAEFVADCRNKIPSDKDALRNAVIALVNATVKRDKVGQIHVLLVADQFEEIFTLTSKRETRDRYINALLAASWPGSAITVHVILALRADFYAQCLEHPGLSRSLQTNLYNVPRMGRDQLRESIERRLQLAAAQAEPGLIDSLLEEVGAEPGNLALLEHALGQLWDKCGGYCCTLTNHTYGEIGRLRGALGRHADEVYSSLGDDRLKGLAQKIFLELVHLGEDTSNSANSNDTRRRACKTDLLSLGEPEKVEQLLARLASNRLISIGGFEQETFVEVSHEALIREWQALREWIGAQRDSLRLERRLLQTAQEWEDVKRDSAALVQGARLVQAEEWLARSPKSPHRLREFVLASAKARDEAAQKKLTRSRWFSCVLALLLIMAMEVAWNTYLLQLREKSRALAAQAEEMRDGDQGQALDLAIRGWRTARTDEARLAVTKTFPQLVVTLNHTAGVETAVFSPDGQRVLTVTDDHKARVWNAVDGQLLATLSGHRDIIVQGEFSPDGQRIVTASRDHTARIWSSADGRLLATLQGHAGTLFSAHFSPNGRRIITSSADGTARVWNATTGVSIAILQGHSKAVFEATFSSDDQHIATASGDHTARVWNATDYTLQTQLVGHTDQVIDAQFSPDSQRIVTSSYDSTARIWNSVDGRLLAILRHEGRVTHAKFSPDIQRVTTSSADHTARVWNSYDGSLLATLKGHTGMVCNVTFSPNGRLILTDSLDLTARVWNSSNGHLLATIQAPAGRAFSPSGALFGSSSTFSPDGRFIVAVLQESTVRVWNVATTSTPVTTFRGHTAEVWSANYSPDSLRIITVSADRTARVWSVVDGHLLSTLQTPSRIYSAIFSPDGQRIVTTSADHIVRVWNSSDGRLLTSIEGLLVIDVKGLPPAISPDSQRIVAVASNGRTAQVWSISGHLLTTLEGHTGLIKKAEFSPDGQRIVTASNDHTARVWNNSDGYLLTTLEGHTGAVLCAQFSPDGQSIVTASNDHTARVWSSSNGRLLTTLEGHTDSVSCAQFSPDGQHILTASDDHTARLWSSSNGRLVTVFRGQQHSLESAYFSLDGQRIVTTSVDSGALVWSSYDGRLLTILARNVVYDAVFSPDGKRIVTADFDRTARLWQVLTIEDIEQILDK